MAVVPKARVRIVSAKDCCEKTVVTDFYASAFGTVENSAQ